MKLVAYILIAVFFILAIAAFYFAINVKGRKAFIAFIYLFCLVFTASAGVFYANYVPDTSPDESAHIAYIYYLESTGEIIPHFEDMHIFSNVVMKWSETPNYAYMEDLVNYLCHPPLYYHIMRLAGGFSPTESDVVITIQKMQLRYFSLGISIIGLLLFFYIGYSRLSKDMPWVHLVYAMTVSSIPMLSYELCAVTNDALTLTTAALCILGLIRFSEGKRNILTYVLVALGITASLLTKLTAAILCIVMALIVLIATMIKEKSLAPLICKAFFISLPIYFIAIAYYGIIYSRYGTLHPSLELISSKEYFENTIYYVAESERRTYNFSQYLSYYMERFFLSWSGIESVYRFTKTYIYSLTAIPYEILWVIPALVFTPAVKKCAGKLSLPVIAGWISLIVTFLYQFKSAYGSFQSRGYLGGFASRYYMPFMPIFALAVALLFLGMHADNGFEPSTGVTTISGDFPTYRRRLLYNTLIYTLALAFAFLMYYGSLPFFLLHYAA